MTNFQHQQRHIVNLQSVLSVLLIRKITLSLQGLQFCLSVLKVIRGERGLADVLLEGLARMVRENTLEHQRLLWMWTGSGSLRHLFGLFGASRMIGCSISFTRARTGVDVKGLKLIARMGYWVNAKISVSEIDASPLLFNSQGRRF